MGPKRQIVIFNNDAGYWFKMNGAAGGAVNLSVGAERYDETSDFQYLIPDLTWNTNQWGDQNKKLIDSKYGFKIVESIFTDPILPVDVINTSPLAPDSQSPGVNIGPVSVIYSYDNNKYLYINPGWEEMPPDEVLYSWVNYSSEATRFTNTFPFVNLLEKSIIGDFSRPLGIERYFFTRPQTVTSYSFFRGGPTGERDIQRAYVAFSKEKGKYLSIDNPDAPYAQMTFTFVDTTCCAFRFQNTITFQNIMNNTILGDEVYGWEIPQFYFNGDVQPPEEDPFTLFWCDDQNGPYECIGYKTLTCDWLCGMADTFSKDFKEYYVYVTEYLLNADCYPNPKDFATWWSQQDYTAFEQWLYEFWINCGGGLGK